MIEFSDKMNEKNKFILLHLLRTEGPSFYKIAIQLQHMELEASA